MSDTTILQIPLSKKLKNAALLVASDYGFSSLQEIVRVLLTKLVKKEMTIVVKDEKEERLSPQKEKRYLKIIEDIKKGKNVTSTKDLDDLFKQLNI